MKESRRLTKADILMGKDNVSYEHFDELGGEIGLRPLTDGQYSRVEAVRARGTSLKGVPVIGKDGNPDLEKTQLGLEIDMEAMSVAEFEADALAVHLSLADDDWTLEEVRGFTPPGIVSKMAKRVYEISGVGRSALGEGLAEQARSFRKE